MIPFDERLETMSGPATATGRDMAGVAAVGNVGGMLDLAPWVWAPLIGAVYIAISWRIGEVFPFSRYGMYSSAVNRSVGAIPVMMADGEPVPVDSLTDFQGLEPANFYPPGIPCSVEWKVHEAARYVSRHRADGAEGPVDVAWGFIFIAVDGDGRVQERLEVVESGRARRRR